MIIQRTINRSLLLALVCLGLAACAGDDDKLLPDQPVEQLYNKGLDLMEQHEYKDAAKQFQEVERQHPYSQWAARAELMDAYANYQAMDYNAANTAIDQFIQMHPGNQNIAYAYYLRALCAYERIADVRRDQGYALTALHNLQEIISRFPDSVYARDAVLKMALVNDHLAGSEMDVGRYYQGQQIYTASVGRFRTVIEKYQTTSHVPEALNRLVECYLALGITNEARATAAVLGHNFPGSTWYENSYNLLVQNNLAPAEDSSSWIGRVWHNVF